MDDCDKLRSENIVFAAMRLASRKEWRIIMAKEVDFRVECLAI